MERLPFGTRARARIYRDTILFFKGRLVPLSIAIVGLVASSFWGHAHVTLAFLGRSIVIVLCTYSIAFIGALVVNTIRAPWRLDAESGQQISDLEKRAQVAEAALEHKNNQQQLGTEFVLLMSEGEVLADELRRGLPQFGGWLQKRRIWRDRVNQALIDAGLPTEAASFRHCSEPVSRPVPAGTRMSDPFLQSLYGEELTRSRAKIQEIAERILFTPQSSVTKYESS